MNLFKDWIPNWLAKALLFVMLLPNMVMFFLPMANTDVVAGYYGIEPSDVQFTISLYYAGFASFYCLERRFYTYFTSKQYYIQFQLFQLLCCYFLFSTEILPIIFLVRFIQGMLFACSVSLYMAMAAKYMKSFRAKEMSYSIFFGMLLAISSINNLITADLIDHYNFDMVYKGALAMFVLSVLIVLICISPAKEFHRHSLVQLDLSSFFLLGIILTGIGYLSVYGQQYYWWENSRNVLILALILLSVGLFITRQLTLKRPYISFSIFKYKNLFIGASLLFLMYIERFSFSFVGSYYKEIFRMDPKNISFQLVYNLIGIGLGVSLAAWHQISKQNIIWLWIAGFFSLLVYHLSMTQLLENTGNESYYILPLFAHGLGIGLIMVPTILFIIGEVPFVLAPSAAAFGLLIRFLGYSASVALEKYFSLYHYTVHYAKFLEYIGKDNSHYQDRIRQIQSYLIGNGLEPKNVNLVTQKILKSQLDRQILLRSVMDYYSLMAYLSVVVILFLLGYYLKKKKVLVHFRPLLPI